MTETTTHTEAEILVGAADLIEEKGWCQFAYASDGRLCPLGAIAAAAGLRPEDWLHFDAFHRPVAELDEARVEKTVAAARRLAEQLGHPANVVDTQPWTYLIGAVGADWNDKGDQTADAVIAALRQAAERARQS